MAYFSRVFLFSILCLFAGYAHAAKVTVSVKGDAAFEVMVNIQKVGSGTVNSSYYKDISFDYNMAEDSVRLVTVKFTNDDGPRALYVQSIMIAGKTYYASAGNVSYVRHDRQVMRDFDGKMAWNGSALFRIDPTKGIMPSNTIAANDDADEPDMSAVVEPVVSTPVPPVSQGFACGSNQFSSTITYGIDGSDVGRNGVDSIRSDWGVIWANQFTGNTKIVQDPLGQGSSALEVTYLEDERRGVDFQFNGGIGSSVDIRKACLSYDIYVPSDFEFRTYVEKYGMEMGQAGGKLPGFYGSYDRKTIASGCKAGVEEQGFTTRFMFDKNGQLDMYVYNPGKTSGCGDHNYIYYPIKTGGWLNLQQEVTLNDVGKSNGKIVVWANGRQVFAKDNMVLRVRDDVLINGVIFSTFFGGADERRFRSPKTQSAYFRNMYIRY